MKSEYKKQLEEQELENMWQDLKILWLVLVHAVFFWVVIARLIEVLTI